MNLLGTILMVRGAGADAGAGADVGAGADADADADAGADAGERTCELDILALCELLC